MKKWPDTISMIPIDDVSDVNLDTGETVVNNVLRLVERMLGNGEGLASAGVAYLYDRKGYQCVDNPSRSPNVYNSKDDLVVVLTVRLNSGDGQFFEEAQDVFKERDTVLVGEQRAVKKALIRQKQDETLVYRKN